MKFFICFLLLSFVNLSLYSGTFDSDVKKAKNIVSKGVLKCHPLGKDGGMVPLEAFKLLKPGMTLHLLNRHDEIDPGESYPSLIIPNDKIIITSDPERINYNVVVKGKDCIIKNAYLKSIQIYNDATIIDSLIHYVSVLGAGDINIYNTAIRTLRSSSGKTDMELKNCTIQGVIRCRSSLKLAISESILYSEDVIFAMYDYHGKEGRISLKDNLLYGKGGYGKMIDSPSSKLRGMVCLEPKELKKIWSVTFLGDNIFEVPKFEERSFVLTDDSPGNGKGIIPEENPVIQILQKNSKKTAKTDGKNLEAEQEKRIGEMAGRGLVKIHPQGRDGGLTPVNGFKILKDGMTLQLLPEDKIYSPITIPNDKIIITTDGVRVSYPVILQGNDCVVKNANLHELFIEQDCSVTDSLTRYLIIGKAESNARNKVDVYNTALKSLSSNASKTTVELKNCTMKGIFKCPSNLKLSISDSILYSRSINFAFREIKKKKGRVLLDNNMICGTTGYGKVLNASSKKKHVLSLEFKDLKKLWTVGISGDTILEMPKFHNDTFILEDDSPGKDRGIIAKKHPMYEILKEKREIADNFLSDEQRREYEKDKRRQDSINRTIERRARAKDRKDRK